MHHARNLDYRCFVLDDGVAGTTTERHLAALECMSNAFALVGFHRDVVPAFGLKAGPVTPEHGTEVDVRELATVNESGGSRMTEPANDNATRHS